MAKPPFCFADQTEGLTNWSWLAEHLIFFSLSPFFYCFGFLLSWRRPGEAFSGIGPLHIPKLSQPTYLLPLQPAPCRLAKDRADTDANANIHIDNNQTRWERHGLLSLFSFLGLLCFCFVFAWLGCSASWSLCSPDCHSCTVGCGLCRHLTSRV